MKIRLLLAYKGTDFLGWQKQKKGRTVQGDLEKTLSHLFQCSVSVTGSGRTDAGAHALGQVAHFKLPKILKKIHIVKALNHLTPNDLSVRGAWQAPESFHARFSVIKKTYQFFISNSQFPPALSREFLYWLPQVIDLKKLNEMTKEILGKNDLRSFETSGSDTKEKTKTIFSAKWDQVGTSLYRFSITGSGFLKQGVRNIVGTQLDLLREKDSKSRFKDILLSCSRQKALGTASSSGLYLTYVYYPQNLDRKCRKL